MLLPKRVKYRRVHRGRMKGKALRGNKITNGQYGLIALEPAWITSNQIEAARIAMTRYTKRGGKVWIFKGEVLPEVARIQTGASEERRQQQNRRNDRRGNGRGDRRDGRRGDRREGGRGDRQGKGAPRDAAARTPRAPRAPRENKEGGAK